MALIAPPPPWLACGGEWEWERDLEQRELKVEVVVEGKKM
jgi:hypothetical protein